MKNFINFTTVKTGQSNDCLTSGNKTFLNPLGRGCQCQLLKGFVFKWLAVRAKLWLLRSLGQVNSVLDKCKPRGQVFVFEGTFSFVSFTLKC